MYSPFELLIRSYRLYRNNLWLLLGYAAWLLLPSAAFLALDFVSTTYETTWWFVPAVILVAAAVIFLGLWLTVVLTKVSAALISEQPIDQQSLQDASWPLISPLLVVAFIQSVIVLGGFLLFIVPGVIFLVWYAFAQFSVVLEGTRGLQSLSESKRLVQDRFWPVLWTLISGPVFVMIIYGFLLSVVITSIGLATGADLDPLFELDAPVWVQILESIADVLVTPLLMLYFTMLYLELKQHPVEKPSKVA